ncbi:type VII secretion target [Kibdelosporangium persicum]|uniref:Excreted virulence factor EspC, type VII ESX diderm n=1 Tax=Kibdelosporangium persicum TaxID=2698649 RepID=A0ABX2F4Q9_9PSEU|nr:type VII secretion target [Kibdelosporangium persicum]NRN65833.1 Excreted virulence factor EspC, type VII ESX diderm [Kibdelosporangium persicum]
MTSGFAVEPDDLAAHGSHLDGLTDRLQTASAAANTAMSPDAYGLICAFLPPIVNPTGEQAKDTITAAVEGIQQIAGNVRVAAEAYRNDDQAQKASFDSSFNQA